MRIWTLSPSYLDTKGLLAVWRETLLAKHVLEGKTTGYTSHPQLARFKTTQDPLAYIHAYLGYIYEEATQRQYSFDKTKFISSSPIDNLLTVTEGQVLFELQHLRNKLQTRAPDRIHLLPNTVENIRTVPFFKIVPGPIEYWEKI